MPNDTAPNDTAPNDTDLPAAIRAALRDNEIGETDLRQPTLATAPSHRSATRWAMGAAAAAVVVLGVVLGVTLPGHRSAVPDGPANGHAVPGYVGYRWTVTKVLDRSGTVVVPHGLKPSIGFARSGAVEGNDTVNALGGRYSKTRSGYTVYRTSTTDAAYAGDIRSRLRIINGVDAMFIFGSGHYAPVAVRATLDSDTLRLQRGPYVLVLHRAGTQPDAPQPSSTGSSTG